MTQVESGNIQLAMAPSSPKEIISYALRATKSQAENKQISFQLDCPEDIPKVHVDKEKTAWVVTNLISNAIRYSHEYSTIFVAVQETEINIEISVKDTGQGIEHKYQSKIFDRYFRVPGINKEGTGLGLAISKEFVEAQGGNILVDSEYGKGSTFTLILKKVNH